MLQALRTYAGYATLVCFLVSGFILNAAQLVIYILVRPFNLNLFRKLNHLLLFSSWSQSVAVVDWATNLKYRIYFKDEQAQKEFGTMSGIVITNHRYDIDWLAAWMICDKLGVLGAGKSIMKSSLRYVPVFGWGSSLSDIMFVSRDWQKDRENIAKSINTLITYPDSLLLSYFEGTRFTPSKHEASIKFAEKNNLPIRLDNHLIPRTRGFNLMLQQIRQKLDSNPQLNYGIYNFQVAIDNDDNRKASLSSVLGGAEVCIHAYIERLDARKVPIDDEDSTSNYLYDVYKEKDRLFDYFKKHGRFPGIEGTYKPRICTLLNWVAWMVVTYTLIIYLYYRCLTSGSLFFIVTMMTLALSVILSVRMLVTSTQVSKSSQYGTLPARTATGSSQ